MSRGKTSNAWAASTVREENPVAAESLAASDGLSCGNWDTLGKSVPPGTCSKGRHLHSKSSPSDLDSNSRMAVVVHPDRKQRHRIRKSARCTTTASRLLESRSDGEDF